MSERVTFEQELAQHGNIVFTNVGVSMMPLLRQGRDLMVIEKKPEGRCKKYDAVLYKVGPRYILHRIVKVREKDYVIVGDNCIWREYGITDDQILGVLTHVVRDGKKIDLSTSKKYWLYVHLWCDFYHVRAAILWLKQTAIRLLHPIWKHIKPYVKGRSGK